MFRKVIILLFSLADCAVVLCAALLVLPGFFGIDTRVVLSGSMEPVCPVGSLLLIRPASVTDLSTGDIITYSLRDDTVITHRIYEIHPESQSFLTRGDANEDPDPIPVSFDALIGKPIFMIPYLGYVLILLQTTSGKCFLAGFIFLSLFAFCFPYAEADLQRSLLKKEQKRMQKEGQTR